MSAVGAASHRWSSSRYSKSFSNANRANVAPQDLETLTHMLSSRVQSISKQSHSSGYVGQYTFSWLRLCLHALCSGPGV